MKYELTAGNLAIATDLYELTMAAAYFENHETFEATFELFVRNFPKNRSYLLAAGLEQAIEYLTNLRFTSEQLNFLRNDSNFKHVSEDFFRYLERFRFTGDVWALPEGTVFFTNEPVLRVTAPVIEAQVLETFLLSVINFETLIATKASRIVQSARGRGVVEFGSRRAHGPEAALLAARASYIGGCVGTSNVLAGYLFKIPTYGTMAHSFIMSYDSEKEAFERFCKAFPQPSFLIDTYDSIRGLKNAISLKAKPTMVRLDSGNRLTLSRKVRKILDDAWLEKTKIFVSGDLNEFVLDDLTSKNAPIDMFGVGTELVTSRDDPALQGIYKLVSVRRQGETLYRAKTSEGKKTLPGAKQIYRQYARDGKIKEDVLSLETEEAARNSVGLLVKILSGGKLVYDMPNISDVQHFARKQLDTLPPKFKTLESRAKSPLRISAELSAITRSLWSARTQKAADRS
jgi:nicotinate phosphoribosyltransferase